MPDISITDDGTVLTVPHDPPKSSVLTVSHKATQNGGTSEEHSHADSGLARLPQMEMSSPIEEIPPKSSPHTPAEQLAPEPFLLKQTIPLSVNSSPFRAKEPASPAVEYVRIKPEDLLVPAPPRPIAPEPPPRPSPAPLIIDPPLQRPMPQKPVLPPMPAQPVTPVAPAAPIAPPRPLAPQPPPRPVVVAPPPQPVAQPRPAAPVVAPMPKPTPAPQPVAQVPPPTPVPAPLVPSPSQAQYMAAQTAELSTDDEAMYYSHNTRAVWQARRSTRVVYISAVLALCVMTGVIITYWISIGAPASLEDVPLFDKIID